jgi:hypothetical protein
MGPTMQMTATPPRNAGQEIAQWAWAVDVGVAVGCRRCDLSQHCQSDDGWLAGSAPCKSSAQVDGAAPPPAMMISPGWAGSRGRDRGTARAPGGGERREERRVFNVPAMSRHRGGGRAG